MRKNQGSNFSVIIYMCKQRQCTCTNANFLRKRYCFRILDANLRTFFYLVESIMLWIFCFWQCEPVLHGWERQKLVSPFTCGFWAPACRNVKVAQRTRQQSHITEWFPALHMLWKPVTSQILVHLCCVLPFVLPNRHFDDAMLPPEVLERLIDLRQQQERSIQNIEKLRDEHRDWQADSCWSAVYTQESHENFYQQ